MSRAPLTRRALVRPRDLAHRRAFDRAVGQRIAHRQQPPPHDLGRILDQPGGRAELQRAVAGGVEEAVDAGGIGTARQQAFAGDPPVPGARRQRGGDRAAAEHLLVRHQHVAPVDAEQVEQGEEDQREPEGARRQASAGIDPEQHRADPGDQRGEGQRAGHRRGLDPEQPRLRWPGADGDERAGQRGEGGQRAGENGRFAASLVPAVGACRDPPERESRRHREADADQHGDALLMAEPGHAGQELDEQREQRVVPSHSDGQRQRREQHPEAGGADAPDPPGGQRQGQRAGVEGYPLAAPGRVGPPDAGEHRRDQPDQLARGEAGRQLGRVELARRRGGEVQRGQPLRPRERQRPAEPQQRDGERGAPRESFDKHAPHEPQAARPDRVQRRLRMAGQHRQGRAAGGEQGAGGAGPAGGGSGHADAGEVRPAGVQRHRQRQQRRRNPHRGIQHR